MKLEDLCAAVDAFDALDARLTAEVAAKAEETKTAVAGWLKSFTDFEADAQRQRAEAATEVKAKFAEMLEYSQMVLNSLAESRRTVLAKRDEINQLLTDAGAKIDPPPDAPTGDMTATFEEAK